MNHSKSANQVTPKRSQRKLRVGIAQMHSDLADLTANVDKLEHFVDQAVDEEVDLIVTPELALTGYPVGSWFSSASMTTDSPEFKRLKRLSNRVPLIVGLIEETEEVEFFNSAVYLADGRVHHLHRKVYLPTYRDFDERRYFMAGWSVSAFNTPWCRMGILICGDCWHLSLPYLLAHDGADVIFAIAASAKSGLTEEISARDAWERLNRTYGLTLSTFIVFANLVGDIGNKHFWGGSHVVNPDGEILKQASLTEEMLLVATLDLTLLRKQRLILPFRRDDSLSLTTQLGIDILTRKNQRIRGMVHDPSAQPVDPTIPPAEPAFPPIGVSDLEFGESGRIESNPKRNPDR